jgi:hypothetical protein
MFQKKNAWEEFEKSGSFEIEKEQLTKNSRKQE